MVTVCIFCGGKSGSNPAYAQEARFLGTSLAECGYGIVYGGGKNGLMGEVSKAAMEAGGTVLGVMPKDLEEVANDDLSEFILTKTMHERKQLLSDRANIFVILAGGLGTLDELFETMAWHSLLLHEKPMFLLNTGNYWEPLLRLLDHVKEHGFTHSDLPPLQSVDSVEELMEQIKVIESN